LSSGGLTGVLFFFFGLPLFCGSQAALEDAEMLLKLKLWWLELVASG